MSYIYLIKCSELNLFKIGVSNSPVKRLKQIQTGCPYNLEIAWTFKSNFSFKLEKSIHINLQSKKIDINETNLYGEWFSDINLENFKDMCHKTENAFNVLKENNNFFFNKK